jgi:hypothetical protein
MFLDVFQNGTAKCAVPLSGLGSNPAGEERRTVNLGMKGNIPILKSASNS